ncbi:hypothetical protein EJ03DRAFT_331644 [Teratosphaeria nubilosa]|uniref:Uncharacterized protein n=1 Tax=Teratosphaeria nubilosa TaxID=161662 RepID=A0A6G1KVL5_9PEZI|nr:hypothetical protein EJ03DRAFT_331644 [Teratosphaeria nubilosa]
MPSRRSKKYYVVLEGYALETPTIYIRRGEWTAGAEQEASERNCRAKAHARVTGCSGAKHCSSYDLQAARNYMREQGFGIEDYKRSIKESRENR